MDKVTYSFKTQQLQHNTVYYTTGLCELTSAVVQAPDSS